MQAQKITHTQKRTQIPTHKYTHMDTQVHRNHAHIHLQKQAHTSTQAHKSTHKHSHTKRTNTHTHTHKKKQSALFALKHTQTFTQKVFYSSVSVC